MLASASISCRFLMAAVGLAALPSAQDKAPVPDAAARAAVQSELLERLASIMTSPGEGSACERLLAAASDPAASPALRYELLQQVMRCARAAGDMAAGLRAATALVERFDVTGVHEAFLAQAEADPRVPRQTVAAACLDAAQQLLEHDHAAFSAALARARRLAECDAPRGLRACVACAAADLELVRAAWERVQAAPHEPGLALAWRTTWRGEWPEEIEAVGDGTDAIARILRSKITARTEPRDLVALARAGEQWLSRRQHEREPIVQRNLSRRAMQLLLPMALTDTKPVAAADRGPAAAPAIAADEVERVRRLLDRATEQAVTPEAGVLRFADAADLDRLLIAGGEWRIEQGRLCGRSLGPDVATRATARFAWRRIDCVTFRAGIQSADGLNLRLAVGNVNVLFNWEVADCNHFYFGDTRTAAAPRVLQAGKEHTIQLRQCGDQVAVCVDGHRVAAGPGRLDGTVTVYPALGSEIFVRSIDVVGDVDLGRVVADHGSSR
ncbi:MAG TPA: hypothetical protein VF384_18910 [Planctomycetota bacterium]